MNIVLRQTVTGTLTVENFPTGREVIVQTDAALQLEFWNPAAGEFGGALSVSAPQAVVICPSAKVRITTATTADVNVVLSTTLNADTVKTVAQVLTDEEKLTAQNNIARVGGPLALTSQIPTTADEVGAVEDTKQRAVLPTATLYRVAFSGDSTMDTYGTQYGWGMSIPVAASMYADGMIEIVKPASRNLTSFAVAGTDTQEYLTEQSGVTQSSEIVAQSSGIDAAVILLGANDMGIRSLSAWQALYQTAATTVAAAINHTILIPPLAAQNPFFATATDTYLFDSSWGTTRAAATVISGDWLTNLGNGSSIHVCDTLPELGHPKLAGFESCLHGLSDGVHPNLTGYMLAGRRLREMFPPSLTPEIDRYTVCNGNPYNKQDVTTGGGTANNWKRYCNGADLSPYFIRASHAPRTDSKAHAGEYFLDLLCNTVANEPDAGTAARTWVMAASPGDTGATTIKYTPRAGVKVFPEHKVGAVGTSIDIKIHRYLDAYAMVVTIPSASTANQVVTAVNAHPVARMLVVASATGTGAGTSVPAIKPYAITVYDKYAGGAWASDATYECPVLPTSGDQVRALIEIHKHPSFDWPSIGHMTLFLRDSAGAKASLADMGVYPGVPEPRDGKIVLTTPWYNHTSEVRYYPTYNALWYGMLRIGAMAVQKRTP